MSTIGLVGLVGLGIGLLLALIIVARIPAFVALLLSSLVVAVAGGIPLGEIAELIQQRMGDTLGFIAIVIGLGAMFGELLRRSGGAGVIADRLLAACGDARAPWALALTGLIVAIPVFFDVALVLLVPLTADLARRSGRSLLYYAVPLLAGIAVGHSFIPPTPGPVAVAGLLQADLGWVIAFGLLAGIPATLVGGLWWGRLVSARIHLEVPAFIDSGRSNEGRPDPPRRTPRFAVAAGLVALPLLLIQLRTVSAVALEDGSALRAWLGLLGHPFSALLVATVLSLYLLGTRLGYSRAEVTEMAGRGLEPVGLIILVTGAGGVFGKVLFATGVGGAVAQWMAASKLPLVALAFLIAAVVRVAQGSATVSMVTAGGLLAPIVEAGGLAAPQRAACVVAVAAGATVLSHVNDSGFWLVGRYLGLSERQTLGVWTTMETLVGVTGFVVALLLSLLF